MRWGVVGWWGGAPWSPRTHLLRRLPLLLELQAVVPQLVHHALVQVHLILEPQARVLQPVGHALPLLQPGRPGQGESSQGARCTLGGGLPWGPGAGNLTNGQSDQPPGQSPRRHESKKQLHPLILALQQEKPQVSTVLP